MKTYSLEAIITGLLLIVFGGIVLHAPLTVALGMIVGEYAPFVKAWKEVVMGGALLLTIVLLTRRQRWVAVSRDWAVRLVAAYGALHLVLLGVFWQGAPAAIAGLFIDLRYVLFFLLVYVVLQVAPRYKSAYIYTAIAGALMVTIFAVLQVFLLPVDVLSVLGYSKTTIMPYLTVDMNHDYIRINSTLRGPNPLGAYAVTVLALVGAFAVTGCYARLLRWQKVVFCVLIAASMVALWYSYSRSALGAALVAMIVVIGAGYYQRISKTAWIAGFVVLGIAAGGVFAARDSAIVANVLLHENPQSTTTQKSNDGHADSLQDGTARMLRQPLGAGIGSTGSASLSGDQPLIIENQYLFVAHESGWAGLTLFVALFGLLLRRLWRQKHDWLSLGVLASGVALAAIGLLLPAWVDDTVSIIWWGLAAVALGGYDAKRRTSK